MPTETAIRVVHGLEAIIDAAAAVLAQQSLTATLDGMARALQPIVPFTSLAVYEADHAARELVPVFAVGLWVEETLAHRPAFDSSLSGAVVLSGEMMHLDPDDPRLQEYTIPDTPDDELVATAIAPLRVGDDVIGTLNVWREDEHAAVKFSADEAQLIRRFATLAALAYANAQQRDQLERLALTDALTGLANRRAFRERLGAELARGLREKQPVSLVLFDLDDFKAVNDLYGHPAGDAVLRGFGEIAVGQARASDVACRLGGEEFATILPTAAVQSAAGYAERVLGATRSAELGGPHITASAGVATAAPGCCDADELFKRADDRLLAAKRSGKDRVVSRDA